MFNFWWLAWLVDGFKPHLPPLYNQKNEMLIFGLCSTSDDWHGWLMDSNPICHLSTTKKMKCSFLDYIQLLMISLAGKWTQTTSATPLQLKNEMLIFGLCSTSDDWHGWLMDSNPICHLSTTKKMKCSFLDYVLLLMIGMVGWWIQTPSATSLQPKKWNAHFWIMFNFCWSAGLVNGNEPHLPHLSSQNNEMLIFGLCSTSDDQLGWLMDSNPKKWNAHFWTTFNFWWLDGLVDWLKLYLPPMSSQKNEMLIFGLHSTSDDQPGWSMDLNPVLYHSPAKIMKCSFLYYVQLLMIGMVGWWIQTPSATCLQPKKWNAHFWIMFNFCWSAGLVNGNQPHLPHLSSQNNEMLIFGLHSTSYDWPGRLMDSNSICHQSPPKVMKCSFLDYIQLLIISLAGQWTWTTSTTTLQLKEWNTHFWITFKFLWLAGQVDGLKPHLPPVSSQKNEMLHFWITFKLLMINWDGQWIWIMSTTSL